MESRNAPAPVVSSSAAAAPAVLVAPAAPAAPAVPAAPAAPASSAVRSSTPQCVSWARKGNVSDISSVSESTKPITLNSEISSVHNSVEGNVECNVENNVTTENIDNSSLNISNEASVTEVNSVHADKNVGVGCLSRPAGLSSSGVPAEVAVSPEPSGARKISTRKSRAVRFSRPSLVDQKAIVWWLWWSFFPSHIDCSQNCNFEH